MDNKLSNKIKFLACVSLLLIPLFVISIVYNGKLSGNDFWWHIKVGEWICTNKALPYEDIFSWYGMENNISWCSQEWLSDVIFYLIFKFFGEVGIYFLCVLLACLLLALIIIHNYKYIKIVSFFHCFFSVWPLFVFPALCMEDHRYLAAYYYIWRLKYFIAFIKIQMQKQFSGYL